MKTSAKKQVSGHSLIELIIGGAIVLALVTAVIELLFLYKAMTQLQQATFEAAREGIVNNATASAITNGFIRHSIDIHGGASTPAELVQAQARATLAVAPILNPIWNSHNAGYTLEILNPTREAFDDFGVVGPQHRQRFIPNSWQHVKDPTLIGETSGVNIHDANILKIRITYGVPLRMPVIGSMIGAVLRVADPSNRRYYDAQPVRIPVTSTAVMHMQSDPIENEDSRQFTQWSLEDLR